MNKELPNAFAEARAIAANPRMTQRIASIYTKYFFVAMAILFIAMAVIGFGQSYRQINAQGIRLFWFVHVHGALSAMWLLMFLCQSILGVKGNLKLHQLLGKSAVPLGLLVWLSAAIVIFNANIGYPFRPNIPWSNVLFIGTLAVQFGVLFILAVVLRKNAATHKRLLVLATLMLTSAGYGRVLFFAGVDFTLHWVPFLSLQGVPNPSGLLLYLDLLMIPLFIYDLFIQRSIHKCTLIASASVVGAHLIVVLLWPLLP